MIFKRGTLSIHRHACALVILLVMTWTTISLAGGGPQDVLLVVNSDSWASMTVANEYIALRHIPARQVLPLALGDLKNAQQIDITVFRARILTPVLGAIAQLEPDSHIRIVAYSSDIPTAAEFFSDLSKQDPMAIGSVTGMTFLSDAVMRKDAAAYCSMQSNPYCVDPQPGDGVDGDGKPLLTVGPSRAFSSLAQKESRYLLSTMLGVTSGRGNSVSEVLDCLRRSAAADATSPKGRFYFGKSSGVRSIARSGLFPSAVAQLKSMGLTGVIYDDETAGKGGNPPGVPRGANDIVVAMCGRAICDPAECGVALPGSIVENLTSEGGIMPWSGGQTPISEFVRMGASGTSGTVMEPHVVLGKFKFPNPFLPIHYARGCSLAEAFYQTVSAPYQLLILGDPLCQPFARPPQFADVGVTRGQHVSGKLVVSPKIVDPANGATASVYEGGRALGTSAAGQPLTIDLTSATDGPTELLFVAQNADPIAAESYVAVPIVVSNAGNTLDVTSDRHDLVLGDSFKVNVHCPGAQRIVMDCCNAPLGAVDGESGQVSIDTLHVGMGLIELHASAWSGGHIICSGKLEVNIAAPKPSPAVTLDPGTDLAAGAILTSGDLPAYLVSDMRKHAALVEAKVPRHQPFRIEGYVEAPSDDVYQFDVIFGGDLTLNVDGMNLALPAHREGQDYMVPVGLAKGLHRVICIGTAVTDRDINIRFGGLGTRSMGIANFSHAVTANDKKQ